MTQQSYKSVSQKLRKLNAIQVSSAGPRYTPGIDAAAPNLQMQDLLLVFDALTVGPRWREHLSGITDELEKQWSRAPRILEQAFRNRVHTPALLLSRMRQLEKSGVDTVDDLINGVRSALRRVDAKIAGVSERLRTEYQQLGRDSDVARECLSRTRQVESFVYALQDVATFMASSMCSALKCNAMFLGGEWGTGKTHFMCDCSLERDKADLPTLFVLAHHLRSDRSPLDALATHTGLARTGLGLLRKLDGMGRRKGQRAVILIDGINEADRTMWRKSLGEVATTLRRYRYVAVVVSCRYPFEKQILNRRNRGLYVHEHHRGFEDMEVNAQAEFFKYYGIADVGIPLLAPEFSRPLFLKIVCRAFQKLESETQKRQFRDIASGQVGMTYVLECFINDLGAPIEDSFKLPRKSCWRFLKGEKGTDGVMRGLAPTMAKTGVEYIDMAECLSIVNMLFGIRARRAGEFLLHLIREGILSDDLVWDAPSKTVREVVRLPYQRFSDHLIARHILAMELNVKDESSIRRSFYRNRLLGQIFNLDKFGNTYASPGLAQAIMIEFPVRVKRVVPDDRELVFYLPRQRRLIAPLTAVFLEGLPWRTRDAFTKQTDAVVAYLLKHCVNGELHQVYEALCNLAARPEHPYSPVRLYNHISKQPVQQRDLQWSEYLRGATSESVIYRLIAWIEERNRIGAPTLKHVVPLLALFLTTTNRDLRNRATRALVFIGQHNMDDLFDWTLRSLDVNDPYVPERMLAASYGVIMRSLGSRMSDSSRNSIVDFARKIIRAIYLPGAPHGTRHAMIRDYSLGIVEAAQHLAKHAIATQHRRYLSDLRLVAPQQFPVASTIADKTFGRGEAALGRDFRNYTLGTLVEGRRNYDFEHPEYKDILRQICWRIADLGFDEHKFRAIDDYVRDVKYRSGQNARYNTERYGKKYSRIAYFEMYGLQHDLGRITSYMMGEQRCPYSDIDPTFSAAAPRWMPPLNRLFRGQYRDAESWLFHSASPDYEHLLTLEDVDGHKEGWVLLDGYISERGAKGDPREAFTFIRGLLVDVSDISRIETRLLKTSYPSSSDIPHAVDVYGTFAGEVPWSSHFGVDPDDGYGKRQITGWLLTQHSTGGEGIMAEVPACCLSAGDWGYLDEDSRGAYYAAPALLDKLLLRTMHGQLDMQDPQGNPATLFRTFRCGCSDHDSHLLYIRRDLLDQYATSSEKTMIWISSGERTLEHKVWSDVHKDHTALFAACQHVHKKLNIWTSR